ncbi:Uncharacterised protein [Kluyvera ascorbata]|nr:hypothetical protein STW0522KLE44_22810 [Klebsiella sp. STW0522-44]STW98812.1 Uncharacterised protein [Kluyvera ascorbata]
MVASGLNIEIKSINSTIYTAIIASRMVSFVNNLTYL